MTERRKRVQCEICAQSFPPEATRLHRPSAHSPIIRVCIECIEGALRNANRELRRLVELWES